MERAAATLSECGAPAVVARALDVVDAGAVADFAAAVERTLGPAYAVVNNAAVLGPVGPVGTVDLGAWRDALVTDVFGTVSVTAAFVGQLERRGGGRVVNLSGGGIGGPNVAGRLERVHRVEGRGRVAHRDARPRARGRRDHRERGRARCPGDRLRRRGARRRSRGRR